MTHAYPRTIGNGSGETLTFVRVVPTPLGHLLEVDSGAEPGVGPPMHVHYLQEEAMAVVAGRMGFRTNVFKLSHPVGPTSSASCSA